MKDLPKPILGIFIFAGLVMVALTIYWIIVFRARFGYTFIENTDFFYSSVSFFSFLS